MQDMMLDAAEAEAVHFLSRERVARAKRAFTTRRVAVEGMRTLLSGPLKPHPGDLVLARVDELGKHRRIELPDGRRAIVFPGDEIIVCYGNRYAPDQFEAVIGEELGSCDLVAGGGIAACELSRHDRMTEPTRITPIGLVGDSAGNRLNVRDFTLPRQGGGAVRGIVTVLSVGTSMNAGKTLAATSLLHGLKAAGLRVAGIKATGTGSGGDLWIMRDAGADLVLDFTDAGFASTYLAPVADLEAATLRLIGHAASSGCDVAVIEIADGLQQLETAALIRSERIRRAVRGVVFSAYDSMGAKFGVDTLRGAGHRVIALSGRLAQSPLGMREAESATGLRVYTPWELQSGALVAQVMGGKAAPSIGRMTGAPLRVVAAEPRTDAIADDATGARDRARPVAAVRPVGSGHRPRARPARGLDTGGSLGAEGPSFAGIAALRLFVIAGRVEALLVRAFRGASAALTGVPAGNRERGAAAGKATRPCGPDATHRIDSHDQGRSAAGQSLGQAQNGERVSMGRRPAWAGQAVGGEGPADADDDVALAFDVAGNDEDDLHDLGGRVARTGIRKGRSSRRRAWVAVRFARGRRAPRPPGASATSATTNPPGAA